MSNRNMYYYKNYTQVASLVVITLTIILFSNGRILLKTSNVIYNKLRKLKVCRREQWKRRSDIGNESQSDSEIACMLVMPRLCD